MFCDLSSLHPAALDNEHIFSVKLSVSDLVRVFELDFMEIEDAACKQKPETVYRELLISCIIDAVKVDIKEYKE